MVSISQFISQRRNRLNSEAVELANEYREEYLEPVTPVDTGALKEGLNTQRRNYGASVNTDKDYFRFPEYGTDNQPPQAYIRSSFSKWVASKK